MSDIIIRREQPEEFRQVENLVREAFWDLYQPGCCEHLLVHKLRDCETVQPDLCLLAEKDGIVAGCIYYSRAVIRTAAGELPVLTFGPLATAPAFQRQGVGAALIRHSVELARNTAFSAILIYGNPDYYRRFGFEAGEKYGITDAAGEYCPALQVLVLRDGSAFAGAFDEGAVYHLTPEEVGKFEMEFPERQQHLHSSQLFFALPSPPPTALLLQAAAENQQQAGAVLRTSGILPVWEEVGAAIRLTGSLRIGLLLQRRDIELQIYADTLDIGESFRVLSAFCARSPVTRMEFRNLLTAEDSRLEWLVWLCDPAGVEWRLTMLQRLKSSPYDGVLEHLCERIRSMLTDETRRVICELQAATPISEEISWTEYCRAVLADGIRTWSEFCVWRQSGCRNNAEQWCP